MKFVNPELEVTMFSVEDILTVSGGPETEAPTELTAPGTYMEGECVGNASDNLVPNCLG